MVYAILFFNQSIKVVPEWLNGTFAYSSKISFDEQEKKRLLLQLKTLYILRERPMQFLKVKLCDNLVIYEVNCWNGLSDLK